MAVYFSCVIQLFTIELDEGLFTYNLYVIGNKNVKKLFGRMRGHGD